MWAPSLGGRGSGEDLADFPGLIGGLARKDPAKMQPMQRALPEFDARGDHAIAAPVGGARDGLVAKLRFEVGHALAQGVGRGQRLGLQRGPGAELTGARTGGKIDRKSTRLNSSHVRISYAVFC